MIGYKIRHKKNLLVVQLSTVLKNMVARMFLIGLMMLQLKIPAINPCGRSTLMRSMRGISFALLYLSVAAPAMADVVPVTGFDIKDEITSGYGGWEHE